MKKFLVALIVIIVLLLVSGYIEMNHCHYWTTTPPMGSDSDYIKNTLFCKTNSVPGLVGGFGIELIKDIVDLVR